MKHLTFFFTIALFFEIVSSIAQSPLIKQWDRHYGGTQAELMTTNQKTNDNGCVLGGCSDSWSWGGYDYWIVKLDELGFAEWSKGFGGSDIDLLYSIQQTSDMGYILGGVSNSPIGGDKTQNNRDPTGITYDYWVIKIDSLRNKIWDRRFGGTDKDELIQVRQTNDGGFLLGGYSFSGLGADKTEASWDTSLNLGRRGDYWIVKIDSAGNKQWDKRYGGFLMDQLNDMVLLNDGRCLLAGTSESPISGNKTQDTRGGWDYWIVMIDSAGNKLWDKSYGGNGGEVLNSIKRTLDGGFILSGSSGSNISWDKTQASWGLTDFWLLKIDSVGNKIWDKDFGGLDDERFFCTIEQTTDSGYILSGSSYSDIGGDKTQNNLGISQGWIIKTDSLGNKEWDKTVLTTGNDWYAYTFQSFDACYVTAMYTQAGIGGDKSQANYGSADFWIVKFCDSVLATNSGYIDPLNSDFSISPNPTQGKVNGKLNHNIGKFGLREIEVFNTLGKLLIAARNINSDEIELDLTRLPSGIYFLQVTTESSIFRKKVIKE